MGGGRLPSRTGGGFRFLERITHRALSYILLSVDFLAVAFIGALFAARRPTNSLGWLLLGIMLVMSVVVAGDGYAVYALYTHPGSLPGSLWAAWASGWLWVVAIGSFLTFVPLLFPTSRLPSPRWRLLGWLTGGYLAFAVAVLALQPRVDLALVYVAGVVGIGGVARALMGQGSNNLAVAASTLAVAALFRPARARIQASSTAASTGASMTRRRDLETFSASLRDEVDLDALTAELVAVTGDGMQPRHVSLWLRGGSPGASHHA